MQEEKVDNSYEKLKNEAEEMYRNIQSVYCPYFKEEIAFNSKGLEHLKFKSKRKMRNRKDRFMRLKNVHLAPEIVNLSHTLQEKQTRNIFVEVKTNKRKENRLKKCNYYGFIAILKEGTFQKRIKVVIRQIEGGEKHFWSLIPYWQSNKQIKLHSGNMNED